ncbi:MAG: AAA family ATPase, partial [Rhodothermaceae bacterium]|nr:AAA family ATPase [Rhodothermaceae bacterium]
MGPENSNSNQNTGGSGPGSPRSPRRRIRYMWIYVVLLGFLLFNLIFSLGRRDPNTIPYSTFLNYVSQGYVESVTIRNDRQVTGKLTDAGIEALGVSTESNQGLLGSERDPALFTTTKTGTHDLVDFLKEHNESQQDASILFEVVHQNNWLGGAFVWLLPLALILLLWVIILRRAGPGSQVLNIGKNRAVLFESL